MSFRFSKKIQVNFFKAQSIITDILDGGASHIAATVRELKQRYLNYCNVKFL